MSTPAKTAASRFLREREDLWQVPLKPPESQRIVLTPLASPDARLVAQTWNRVGGLLARLSTECEVEPGVALAVLCVESSAKGFSVDGRLVIRFENHIFWRRWGQLSPVNKEIFGRHFRVDRGKKWLGHEFRTDGSASWASVHRDQASEWQALGFARQLDDTAALCSASMGSPQIMGFHHARLGYASVQEMFAALAERATGERAQILGLFDFVSGPAGGAGLLLALRRKDFLAFATRYNGPGQAAAYSAKLERHCGCFAELIGLRPSGTEKSPASAGRKGCSPCGEVNLRGLRRG